jgi:hypothetical protein
MFHILKLENNVPFYIKKYIVINKPPARFELATYSLQDCRSTPEL